jgi:magnesium chelatase subunit I
LEYCRTRGNLYQTSGTFVLVGSGNPEEGELRPQLLDRFGMHAEIRTGSYFTSKVVEERTSFDQNPMLWIENYESQQQELRDKIVLKNYYQVLILIML